MRENSSQQSFLRAAVLPYILALVTTYLIAVLGVSQFNASSVASLGVDVGVGDRLYTFSRDLVGMSGSYLPLIAIGFAIALPVARFALLPFIKKPLLLFPLAGFVAVLTIHLLLKMLLGISAIAPTATLIGLITQALAGAVGGYVFVRSGSPGLMRDA